MLMAEFATWVKYDQDTKFAEALIKSEPNRKKIALTVFGEKCAR